MRPCLDKGSLQVELGSGPPREIIQSDSGDPDPMEASLQEAEEQRAGEEWPWGVEAEAGGPWSLPYGPQSRFGPAAP